MERGDDILKRIANDPSSSNFNSAQQPGQYLFAGDATQLDAAFKRFVVRSLASPSSLLYS
jgi:hypothetical protein